MNLYNLVRDEDISGVSGTGVVAEVAEYSDGTCAMRWVTEHRSTAVYASMADLLAIHGHDGRTRVVPTMPTEAWTELRDWWRYALRVYGSLPSNHPLCCRLDRLRATAQKYNLCTPNRTEELIVEEAAADRTSMWDRGLVNGEFTARPRGELP